MSVALMTIRKNRLTCDKAYLLEKVSGKYIPLAFDKVTDETNTLLEKDIKYLTNKLAKQRGLLI